MFDFFSMVGNYDERKVDHTDLSEGVWVDTCAVTDASQPYETAVEHPEYHDGKMVIVEMYNTLEAAQEGHNRWVATMSAPELPESLVDKGTAGAAEMIDILSDDSWRVFPRVTK